MKSTNIIIFYLLAIFCYSCSLGRAKDVAKEADLQINAWNAVCGDSVIWHLHLQDGFKGDTIKFLLGQDTFANDLSGKGEIIATSGNNSCTNVYFTSYAKDGQKNSFLSNMPRFRYSKKVELNNTDSIDIGLMINDQLINFNASLRLFNSS